MTAGFSGRFVWHLPREFRIDGRTFKITGANFKRVRYPITATCSGKTYKFANETVKKALGYA